MQLRLSIVTIAFNNLEELIKTMNSVDGQELLPYEHIIVDGSSNNEIENYLAANPQPAYRKFKTEPDKGISDAFNKGVIRANGDVLHILNSGDYYASNKVIAEVMKVFESDGNIKWTHGEYVQHLGNNWVTTGKAFDPKLLHMGMHKVGHPSMFVKKELYEKHGLFDVNLKYAMDYDFLVRIAEEKFSFLPMPIVVFTPGGASNVNRINSLNESFSIYRKYKGLNLKLVLRYVYLRLFYLLIETRLGSALLAMKNRKKLTSV